MFAMTFYTRKSFWLGVAERALKTAAQAMLAELTTGTVIWGLDWARTVGVGLTAAVWSVLTALGDPERTDVATVTGA